MAYMGKIVRQSGHNYPCPVGTRSNIYKPVAKPEAPPSCPSRPWSKKRFVSLKRKQTAEFMGKLTSKVLAEMGQGNEIGLLMVGETVIKKTLTPTVSL
jgi:hypothetical protein